MPPVAAAPETGEALTPGDRLRQRAAEYRRKGYPDTAERYEQQAIEMDTRDAVWGTSPKEG